MATTTKRRLLDLTPSDQLAPAWLSLDEVLSELRYYLMEDNDESSLGVDGSATGLAVRPQSALVALLSRLLPVIEAFFLVHVGDIFNVANTGGALPKVEDGTANGSVNASAAATATTGTGPSPSPAVIATITTAAEVVTISEGNGAGNTAPAAVTSSSPGPVTAVGATTGTTSTPTPTPATPSPAVAATTPSSAAVPPSNTQSSMPGERYRSTSAYAALNLSLLPPDVLAAIGQACSSPPSSPHATTTIQTTATATATMTGGAEGGHDPSAFAATVMQLTSLQRTRSLRNTSSSFGISSSNGPPFLALPHSSSASTLMGLAGT